ncbi:Uncharacterised protein [Pragia fontium]|uniref:hypothetical protein n=1 Tax=Pragia fontium TaxID=82985 RepID=UPI000E07E999|nr:hypothetical protein [Pragia fontium]SUB81987.1 Uncharacterised protein [Pragia fontium]
MQSKLSHDELCIRAERFLKTNGFGVVFHDKFRANASSGELPDALGFRNGVSCLIEVKCSRSDFQADKKKHFRIKPELGLGDWRFYMCEPGIITVDDLPVGWGLLHVKGNQSGRDNGEIMEILITVKRDIVYSIDMTAEEFGALKEHEILAALDDEGER